MVSFSMTLSDPNPGFKVAVYLQVEYLKKLLKNTNRKSYTIYRMIAYHFQWPWVTADPDSKVTTFFDIEYLRNISETLNISDLAIVTIER